MSAELAITGFSLFVSVLFFMIPRMMLKPGDENTIGGVVLQNGCYMLGWFMMMASATMVMEIASVAGYYTGMYSTYILFFFIVVICTMCYLFLKSIVMAIKLIKIKRDSKRGLA